jgi:hypothetical protein
MYNSGYSISYAQSFPYAQPYPIYYDPIYYAPNSQAYTSAVPSYYRYKHKIKAFTAHATHYAAFILNQQPQQTQVNDNLNLQSIFSWPNFSDCLKKIQKHATDKIKTHSWNDILFVQQTSQSLREVNKVSHHLSNNNQPKIEQLDETLPFVQHTISVLN